MAFSSQWWEHHYQQNAPGHGTPSSQLTTELAGLPVGTALDAGCGTGADAIWLARQGWDVTAVDVSPTALRRAEELAVPEIAGRITWMVADLTVWEPPTRYDLVVSQYVHPDLPFGEFVARLARAVAPGGTLFVVGHDHADSHSAAHAPAPASITVDAVIGALDADLWDIDVAEARTRHVRQLAIEDVVVRAHRRS